MKTKLLIFKSRHTMWKVIFPLLFITQTIMASPFVLNSDNTVTDTATGLIWQRCSMGQIPDNLCSGTETITAWADALTYCNTLTIAGKTWRLPNINELKSIADRSKASGASIDLTAFPSALAGSYWSSSTFVLDATKAWHINFNNGFVGSIVKVGNFYVRCVSGP